MGAGASLDNGLTVESDGTRYFCYSCHRVFRYSAGFHPEEFTCPNCQSAFLEEIGNADRNDIVLTRRSNFGRLTFDQTRRITNATAMLRLLETQLRDELESLQQAFESANMRMGSNEKKPILTKIMRGKLRKTNLNIELACGQPSCPICADDFVLGSSLLKLPCTHVFHEPCVMPWLEMKQNCPICRQELNNEVPTLDELEKFSNDELMERLKLLDVEIMDNDMIRNRKTDLAQLLHQHMDDYRKEEEQRTQTQENNAEPSFNFTSPSTTNRPRLISFATVGNAGPTLGEALAGTSLGIRPIRSENTGSPSIRNVNTSGGGGGGSSNDDDTTTDAIQRQWNLILSREEEQQNEEAAANTALNAAIARHEMGNFSLNRMGSSRDNLFPNRDEQSSAASPLRTTTFQLRASGGEGSSSSYSAVAMDPNENTVFEPR